MGGQHTLRLLWKGAAMPRLVHQREGLGPTRLGRIGWFGDRVVAADAQAAVRTLECAGYEVVGGSAVCCAAVVISAPPATEELAQPLYTSEIGRLPSLQALRGAAPASRVVVLDRDRDSTK